jgi:fluoride exporter
VWVTYLCVFIGAAIGGVGRYSLSSVVANWIGATLPWGTLIVNVTGCFVIGIFNTLTGPDGVFLVPGNLRVFVMVGM